MTGRFARWAAIGVLAGLAAQAVQAQQSTPTPPPTDEIVVEGLRLEALSEEETRKIASSFVRKLTVIDPFEALALYEPYTYCPAVVGLSAARNAQIEARMRQVADAAGIKPAKAGCATSALVLLVDDKKTFVEEFRRTHPVYFKDERVKVWSLPKEEGPALAWQLASLINENGEPVGYGGTVESVSGGSRLLSLTKTAIAMSVVIVERDALRGLNIEQISDYVLMRGLVSGDPSDLGEIGAASILTVLSTPMGGETYASLTEWDLAYIKELYRGDPRIYGQRKGAALRRVIREALDERPAARLEAEADVDGAADAEAEPGAQ